MDGENGVSSPYDTQIPSTSSFGFSSCANVDAQEQGSGPSTPYKFASPFRTNQQQQSPCRQIQYASDDQNPAQKIRENLTARANWAQSWLNGNLHTTSSANNSRAQSVISGVSGVTHITQMTNISKFSALTIDTKLTGYTYVPAEEQAVLQVASETPTGMGVENQNPQRSQLISLDMQMEQLYQTLTTTSSVDNRLLLKTVNTIFALAKSKRFDHADCNTVYRLLHGLLSRIAEQNLDPSLVNHLLITVFYMLDCRNGLAALNRLFIQPKFGAHVVQIICARLNPLEKYTDYAVLLLVKLMSIEGQISKIARKQARSTMTIDRLVSILSGNLPDRPKRIAIDCCKKILFRSPTSKEYFTFDKGGMAMLIRFVNEESDEKVLFNSVHTLIILITTEGTKTVEEFIRLQGIQVLCKLLSHGSTRLLWEILKCLGPVVQVKKIAEQNLDASIRSLLQLFGTNDAFITNNVLGILFNIILIKPDTKQLMVKLMAPSSVLGILATLHNFINGQPVLKPAEIRMHIDEICEYSIKCLKNLTNMNDEVARAAVGQIVHKQGAANIFMNMLASPGARIDLRIKTLYVVYRVLVLEPRFAPAFVEARIVYDDECKQYDTIVTYLMRVLWASIHGNVPKEDPNALRDFVQHMIVVLTELIKCDALAMQIINTLSEGHLRSLEAMIADGPIRSKMGEFIQIYRIKAENFYLQQQQRLQYNPSGTPMDM